MKECRATLDSGSQVLSMSARKVLLRVVQPVWAGVRSLPIWGPSWFLASGGFQSEPVAASSPTPLVRTVCRSGQGAD